MAHPLRLLTPQAKPLTPVMQIDSSYRAESTGFSRMLKLHWLAAAKTPGPDTSSRVSRQHQFLDLCTYYFSIDHFCLLAPRVALLLLLPALPLSVLEGCRLPMALAAARGLILRPHTRFCAVTRVQSTAVSSQPRGAGMASAAASGSGAAAAAPAYMLLRYAYVSDILERRGPYRDGHLAGARAMQDAGKLVLAGEARSCLQQPPHLLLGLLLCISPALLTACTPNLSRRRHG